jgi:DNA-binding transcriptional regulator GbsR (MarR family)
MTFENIQTIGDAFKLVRTEGANMKLSHINDLKHSVVGKGSGFRKALVEAKEAIAQAEDKDLKADLRTKVKRLHAMARDFKVLCNEHTDTKKADKAKKTQTRLEKMVIRRDKLNARLEKLNASITKLEIKVAEVIVIEDSPTE